jgi:hypothetical protein
MTTEYFAHPTAVIDSPVEIGCGTKIWHFAHICAQAKIGRNCIFGQNTMVSGGVVIGDNVKVQNNVAIYTGTTIEDDVFLGPSCVLTNVTNPRSQVNRQRGDGWRECDDCLWDYARTLRIYFGRGSGDEGCARLRAHGRRARAPGRLDEPAWSSAQRERTRWGDDLSGVWFSLPGTGARSLALSGFG